MSRTPETGQPARKRRWFRFSLRTLVIFVLLAASGMGLWWRWEPWIVLMAFNDVPTDVGFAPDGSFFYTYRWIDAAKAACTTVWDTQTQTVRFSFAEPAEKVGYWQDGIRSSPNARWFTVREQTGIREHVFDADTGEKIRLAVPGPVLLPETPFSPDGDRLIYSTDADVRLRNMRTGRETVFVVPAEFLPDYVTYLPLHERVVVQSRKRQPGTTPEEARLLSQGRKIVGPVRVLDADTGRQIPLDLPPRLAPDFVVIPHVSPLIALYRCQDHENPHGVLVVDVLSGKRISQIRCVVEQPWNTFFTPDDRFLVAGVDGKSYIFDPLTGRGRFVAPGGTAETVFWREPRHECAFSHDGVRVIQLELPREDRGTWASIWDLKQGCRVAYLAESPRFNTDRFLEFSQDDRRVVGPNHGAVWDAATGRLLLFVDDHLRPLPDEKKLLVFGADDARILDATTGRELSRFPGTSQVSPASFSPDGRLLLTTDRTDSAFLWSHRRPEPWWGVAWLPEFWLTLLFAPVLAWSVWRNRRTL